jgi:hypothetical protein
LASDFFVPEDFDGDHKDDIAIWRPGVATQASFYILNSALPRLASKRSDRRVMIRAWSAITTTTVRLTWRSIVSANSGQCRAPGITGLWLTAPSLYISGASVETRRLRRLQRRRKQRLLRFRDTAGSGYFWQSLNGSGATTVVQFGISTDIITPGDYDGDGKTDFAVARGSAGSSLVWYWRPSGGGVDQQVAFGSFSTDYTVQGDYDGDGKTDQAIWRDTDGYFWVRNVATGAVTAFQLGSNGDYPVGNFTSH